MDLETRIRHALQDPARRPSPDFAHGVMAGLPARQTSHSWSPRSLSVPLVGATALVLALAIVLLEPVMSPNGSAVPNPSTLLGSASPGVSGSAMATSGTYFDGIPREIDGEVVLRGSDIAATVAASVDDTPFLIGGWATGPIRWRCVPSSSDGPRPALLPCGAGTAIHLMDGPDRTDGILVMSLDQGVRPVPGATVLRVHLHDSLAATCPETNRTACERAIVLDEVMWTQSSVLVTPTP